MEPTFTTSFIRYKKKIKTKNALMVIGLPGIGFVSKMAVDNLVTALKSKKIATIYSPHFPNQVLTMPSGKLRPFSIRIHYAKIKNTPVFLLKGDLQPLTVEGQYEVSAAILKLAKELGVKEVLAMAGFAVQGKKNPEIYCASTSKKLFTLYKKLGAKPLQRVIPVVGMAGLLPALAKSFEISGSCLLVETPGTQLDSNGAKALTKMLGKKLGEKFDTKDLERKVRKAEKLLSQIEMQAKKEETQLMPKPNEAIKDALNYIR
ncbi:MAG: PAC2 family protein [Candidatus Micrarchaeota archaeon]